MSDKYLSGVGFPSYAATATFAAYSGFTSDASYPVTNLADLRSIRSVATFANPGTLPSWAFTAVLPAAQALQFFALVHHTLPAAATFRIDLFSDTNPDPVGNLAHRVYTTGYLDVWPANSYGVDFPALRPLLLQNGISARSVYVEIRTNVADAVNFDVGAFEMSGWWDWSDMQQNRALGFDSRATVQPVTGNIDLTTQQWNPRAISGVRANLADTELDTTAVDYQKQLGTWGPVVFVDDYQNPSSWQRRAFLARNKSIKANTVDNIDTGSFAFDLVEWIG